MSTQVEDRWLKILNYEEIATLFAPPVLTDEERQQYFSLSPDEAITLNGLAIKSRVYCILQLGYFKARQQFFPLDASEIHDDIAYIYQLYFPNHEIDTRPIAKDTRTKQQ